LLVDYLDLHEIIKLKLLNKYFNEQVNNLHGFLLFEYYGMTNDYDSLESTYLMSIPMCNIDISYLEQYFYHIKKIIDEKRILDKYYIKPISGVYYAILIEDIPLIDFDIDIDILLELIPCSEYKSDTSKSIFKICYLDKKKNFHSYLVTKTYISIIIKDTIKLFDEIPPLESDTDSDCFLISSYRYEDKDDFDATLIDLRIEQCTQVLNSQSDKNIRINDY